MKQVTPGELQEWISSKQHFQLVDVREAWERDAFNIGGDHIPMNELMARMAQLHRHEPVVLYCEKGIRSVIAIQRLEGFGFNNLCNLAGGMKAWKEL